MRFAAECRRLFESGSRWFDANLFNGEYYVQKVRGMAKDQIAKGTGGGSTADPTKPDFQLGEGCLVDQLVGQYLATVAGLGPLLKTENIGKTARAIWKHNFKPDLFHHEAVQRVYALNDEAGLVICDYASGKRPRIPFPYFAELMTGFEYSAAILMLQQGMLKEGLQAIAAIRRRYDGERRNPWDEAECGHHYARAMASWSAIVATVGLPLLGCDEVAHFEAGHQSGRLSLFLVRARGLGHFRANQNHRGASHRHRGRGRRAAMPLHRPRLEGRRRRRAIEGPRRAMHNQGWASHLRRGNPDPARLNARTRRLTPADFL